MAGPAETNRRVGRRARVLMGVQSGLGTLVTDFTAATAITLWTESSSFPIGRGKALPDAWMTEGETENEDSQWEAPDQAADTIVAVATPESVEFFLRSNWGPFAAGSFTLLNRISELMTLALIESNVAGAGEKLIRIGDAWFHRVTLNLSRERGLVLLTGEYAGRSTTEDDLDALGPITLPAGTMPPSNKQKFIVNNTFGTFIREPSGANVRIRFISLDVVLQQGLNAEYTMTNGWVVNKRGKTLAQVTFEASVSDETWELIMKNRAKTPEPFRITLVTPDAPTKTLTIDFESMQFTIEALGFDPGRNFVNFRATSRPLKSTAGFATITLS